MFRQTGSINGSSFAEYTRTFGNTSETSTWLLYNLEAGGDDIFRTFK